MAKDKKIIPLHNSTQRPVQSNHLMETGLLKEKLVGLISQSPKKAAIILTEWIKQSTQKDHLKKTGS